MARRGENIYKRRDGRWEGRYAKSRKVDGSIRYGYVYATTYKELKMKLVEHQLILKQAGSNPNPANFRGTITTWINYWLETISHKVKPSTYSSYKNKLECYVEPHIGSMKLHELTTDELNQLINQWVGVLSAASIRIVFQVLKSCLREAEQHGFLAKHIYENVQLPKITKNRIRALTLKERTLVTQLAEQDIDGFPIFLSLETGLRIGEIAGLKWQDINFAEQTLTVSRTLQRIQTFSSGRRKTTLFEGSPKTQMSRREIPLSDKMMLCLKAIQKDADCAYVVSKLGKPIEPRTITNHFKRIIEHTGISHVSFHALRHSFATRCLECGVNIAAISALLGHTSVKLTLDVYTNTTRSEERRAINMLVS